jgi:hypothetical protein
MVLSPVFQWVAGLLLTVIAYFVVRLVSKLDDIDKNVNTLMIHDGVKQEQIRNHAERIHSLERTNKLSVQ